MAAQRTADTRTAAVEQEVKNLDQVLTSVLHSRASEQFAKRNRITLINGAELPVQP